MKVAVKDWTQACVELAFVKQTSSISVLLLSLYHFVLLDNDDSVSLSL
jgi:hypothetical protein